VVAVRLENVTRTFGPVTAADSVTLDVAQGELFFLLGPSGCGKTTLLRTVAGFEAPDSGRVLFDGKDVTSVPPHRRNTGMVFQNYALWPHMTVFDNVAYGLRVRKTSRAEVARRVDAALEMVRMPRERDRYPNQLSGGQQQRVALARALVINPACLLLDEPLSNLDAKLRLEMRAEIRRIHDETAVTTIYVTHDQKEALSMAERLAILSAGRVIQVGRPGEVYRDPVDAFVAAFIGETNLLPGTVAAVDEGRVTVDTEIGRVVGTAKSSYAARQGARAVASVRPEDVLLGARTQGANAFEGTLEEYTFLGEVGQYAVLVGRRSIKAVVAAPCDVAAGERLAVSFDPGKVLVLPEGPAGGA
jgi:iron(III) transport system ATP-binding protein